MSEPLLRNAGFEGLDEVGPSLLPLLACPACGRAAVLAEAKQSLRCRHCLTAFPVVEVAGFRVPWLHQDPGAASAGWRARYGGFLASNDAEQNRLQEALAGSGLGPGRLDRLTRLLDARIAHREQVATLLEPFKLHGHGDESDASTRTMLPASQGLLSYYPNIFRDWAWENGEREALCETLLEVVDEDRPHRKVLTLGSGAGRLSYDLHQRLKPSLSVLLDINPLLAAVAAWMAAGSGLSLYEFPIAPRDGDHEAILQTLKAPSAAGNQFYQVLGDGLTPPFAPGAFDTVVTPWLIDVIPEDVAVFAARVNGLLEQGGVWLNTGTLAFFHSEAAWCYDEDELFQCLEGAGFRVLTHTHRELSYLRSPGSCHGRLERVLSFSAEKVASVDPPGEHRRLPEFLVQSDHPVPKSEALSLLASRHLFQAQVLSAIDGERSTAEISELIAHHYRLPVNEVKQAVRRVLLEIQEESHASRAWLDYL